MEPGPHWNASTKTSIQPSTMSLDASAGMDGANASAWPTKLVAGHDRRDASVMANPGVDAR